MAQTQSRLVVLLCCQRVSVKVLRGLGMRARSFYKGSVFQLVSPFFSLYRALRWFALSPLIPMSLGLTQSFSTKLAQALGVHLIFVFSTEALAISRWSRHQLQSVFHPAQTGSGDPSWVPVPFLVPKKRSSTLAICRGDSVTPKNSVAPSPRPDFSSSGQCDRIISASVCLTGFQYSRRRKSSVVYKRNKSIVRVAP